MPALPLMRRRAKRHTTNTTIDKNNTKMNMSQDDELDDVDAFGDALMHCLNASQAFNNKYSQSKQPFNHKELNSLTHQKICFPDSGDAWTTPLLSYRNLRRLLRLVGGPIVIHNEDSSRKSSSHQEQSTAHHHRLWSNVFVFFGLLLLALVSIFVVASVWITVQVTWAAYLGTGLACSLLLETSTGPFGVARQAVKTIASIVDLYVCQGYRYIGREGRSYNHDAACGISAHGVSAATKQHHIAINFCHDMMMKQQQQRGGQDQLDGKKRSRMEAIQYSPQNASRRVSRSSQSPIVPSGTFEWKRNVHHHHRNANNGDGVAYMESHQGVELLSVGDQSLPSSPTLSRQASGNVFEAAAELPWMDVGAKIGMRLLNSAHVHRVMSATTPDVKRQRTEIDGNDDDNKIGGDEEQTHERNVRRPASEPRPSRPCSKGQGNTMEHLLLNKPIHTLWTSPSAAAMMSPIISNKSEDDDGFLFFPPGSDDKIDTTTTSNHIKARKQTLSPILQLDRTLDGRPPLSPRSIRKASDASILQQRNPSVTMELESSRASDDHEVCDNRDLEEEMDLSPPDISRIRFVDRGARTFNVGNGNEPHQVSRVEVPKPTAQVCCQRSPLEAGMKVAVPISPFQPRQRGVVRRSKYSQFQMGTVVASERIFVGSKEDDRAGRHKRKANCLSVTVKLDKSFLRNAEFAELTFRVMDTWGSRYMPKYSKAPIGACVATKYGIGVLVGWRVEGDVHVIRSLWNRRGAGSANAYLTRGAILCTMEAAIGFDVQTRFGGGVVLAYIGWGKDFGSGKYLVAIKQEGRHCGHVLEIQRGDVYSCYGSHFIPVIEHIREAAAYQIQVDNYNAALREQLYSDSAETSDPHFWKAVHECGDILWESFISAVEEDKDFDAGVNEFMASIIEFLDRLDASPGESEAAAPEEFVVSDFEIECVTPSSAQSCENETDSDEVERNEPGLWLIDDFFGGLFKPAQQHSNDSTSVAKAPTISSAGTVHAETSSEKPTNFDRAFAVIRTLMLTVTIAKAASVQHTHFRLALTVVHEVLLFIRNVLKVVYKNRSSRSTAIWKEALLDCVSTMGPMKARIQRICGGVAQRMEKQGRKAKVRALQLVDTIISDEKLLLAMEQGDWAMCANRVEIALIKSNVIQKESLFYYRKTAQYVYTHIQSCLASNEGAATRSNEKAALIGHAVRCIAAPRRSALKFLLDNNVLEFLERILVRVYRREEIASRMLTIHASNFHSLRHLRILKDISVAGRMWRPLLDAADEELSYVVSSMPENSKELMCPLSSLFSLCVARFHKMTDGDLSKDWLDFLLERDAVRIIQDIDMKLLLALKTLSEDIKNVIVILPYYSSIDADILKLMDEVDVDDFLKDAAEVLDDPDALSDFLKEKATIAVERFLDYLPKMSIPVEKREIGEGFVLTCRGHDGSDLTLSDVAIGRENLVCQILGGDSVFFPMFGDNTSTSGPSNSACPTQGGDGTDDDDVLSHIRVLLLQAQSYGCWTAGVGGVDGPASDRYVASVLQGLPVSSVLNCAIELWRNLEIDDDELLEVAIKDVSLQINLQQRLEEGVQDPVDEALDTDRPTSRPALDTDKVTGSGSFEGLRRRFNPRIDPSVLFIEMKNLTLNLDSFQFRIEKSQPQSIFDPVFEGRGMISLRNISMRLRIECAKQRVVKAGQGIAVATPILRIQELAVSLEDLKVRVEDTGFGSDWLLNRVVKTFAGNITKVVEENLHEQIRGQCESVVDNMNAYFAVNPNILLSILGISIDDLDDTVLWV